MTTFSSIRIEGGLLGPDVLDQLISANLPGQRPADFGLDARRNLTDEIAAVFADTRALWGVFQNRLARLPQEDIATRVTRDAWMIPFLGLIGYELRYNQRAYEVDGLTFAISHRSGEAEDTPPVHIVGARQELGRVPASGRPRLAPHSLVQEFINRTENLWGLVTNGRILRLLRDCTFVRRQAYVEFDLEAIIEEQRFQDFAGLYRLLHRTRLPRTVQDAACCLLEEYYAYSVEQGGRVREHLRDGVEECITRLANGFLSHRANDELRRRVSPECTGNERITAESLYRQLLRLVYRFLFLLVSEDRGLLSPDPIYREHYGIERLRRLLDQRAAYTDHDDIWQSLRVLWRVLSDEKLSAFLNLAPLNGELFSPQAIDTYTLTNRDLLEAFWCLSWYQESATSPPRRVNYAALDVEELGSVYESLLEFHPAVDMDAAKRPIFSLIYGSERKTTGSFYTPPQLVNELIQSALDPVIGERLQSRKQDPQNELLAIRVCDPACGSGHFLLAAARRIGKELARVRTGEDEPAPERMREAVRDVISHCIYGVDKNPLAVDLCRVALWLESHTGGKPLTFLDHRIRCGDSLIGVFNLEVLKDGIPDKAFDPLEGDDKAAAREAARRNRQERTGQIALFAWKSENVLASLTSYSREVGAIDNDSPETIRRKKMLFEKSHAEPVWLRQHEACNLWTAAFFQSLTPGTVAITSGTLTEHLNGRSIDPRLIGNAEALSIQQRFFHWPLEFPEVFQDGGFDVILSNPPWERVKLQEQEFFAARDARIANAPNKAARARLIRELQENNPELHREFIEALRAASGASAILRHSGRFPLTGRGDINTYAVFAELCRMAIRPSGRTGIIVPSGIATDDTTKFFFQDMIQSNALVSLFDFENRKGIFPAVHKSYKFCLLTCTRSSNQNKQSSIFVFFALDTDDLRREEKRFTLTAEEIALINPNTGNCPIFRTQADAELTKAIYRRVPVLWREAFTDSPEINPWKLSFKTLFHMSNDSHHFRTAEELEADGYQRQGNIFASPYDTYLPLYEAKMLHQFDHRWATYENATESRDVTMEEKRDPSFVGQPRYWVREEIVESAVPKYPEPLALALKSEHQPSIQTVLCCWVAGYHLNRGNRKSADTMLNTGLQFNLERSVARWFGDIPVEQHAVNLDRDFPLVEADIQAIIQNLDTPEVVANELVERFSPKWFLGWRDICRSTDDRTLIASVTPRVPIGHTFPLVFFEGISPKKILLLLANLNSLAADYLARQKVGGTHITYNLFKQFSVISPDFWKHGSGNLTGIQSSEWISGRVLELVYTANDLSSLARDSCYEGLPFSWNEIRRFEIRCELDAAFFHLYLPSGLNGEWQRAKEETPGQLTTLKHHFPKPRDAVAYILDQFPIVRQKDEKAHSRYRTKERIIEIYDAMLTAQYTGKPYVSGLNPPPGSR